MLQTVQNEINRLRNADIHSLELCNRESTIRRTTWFNENRNSFRFIGTDPVESAYRLLLYRFNITEDQAPVVQREKDRIVFHSQNFCPTLEACKILKLDTRFICRHYNEQATDALVKQIDGRLTFTRNYDKLRPHTDYCEEMISIENGEVLK